ncbi:hypothetical protein CXB51_024570 [Gossypium anomalum]|uniref:RNase H type-1 domain-containing protein n=1 Tax=Gossypium anomalum TaxID=47600 RepID=A0A8J6CMF5_9ROSI|nr:hypothetical protein CXB51_024570 [Gossypium anomalum]
MFNKSPQLATESKFLRRYRIQERLWWLCPYKCGLSNSGSVGWCFPPHGWLKFNVSGVASEGESGCGGVMRDDEGIVRALFSGLSDACDAESAELGAIITAMENFNEIGWKGSCSLIVEMGSRVVFNWILEKSSRPWLQQTVFANLIGGPVLESLVVSMVYENYEFFKVTCFVVGYGQTVKALLHLSVVTDYVIFISIMITLEDEAGCGGVLRDEKGVVCALFSGLIVARGSKMAEIIAIKTVVG